MTANDGAKQRMSIGALIRQRRDRDAERERIVRQKYEEAYQAGEQILPWGLKNYLDGLGGDKYGEGINDLLKQQGDMGAVYDRAPHACPAIVELIVRELKLSPPTVAAALNLPPLPHDGLDTLLLIVGRELAPEARNGLLPLSRMVAEVNAGCAPNDGLTPKFIAGRMRALGYVLTDHHPVNVVVIPKLLPPVLDVPSPLLLASPEASNARESGSHTE